MYLYAQQSTPCVCMHQPFCGKHTHTSLQLPFKTHMALELPIFCRKKLKERGVCSVEVRGSVRAPCGPPCMLGRRGRAAAEDFMQCNGSRVRRVLRC